MAHLVFADTQANAQKTKRAIFRQHSEQKIYYICCNVVINSIFAPIKQ
jgi:hypothetical protein